MDIKIKPVKPNFKPLKDIDLRVKVSIEEYKYDEEKDELFIKLRINDYPFIVYREITIPLRRGIKIDIGEDI